MFNAKIISNNTLPTQIVGGEEQIGMNKGPVDVDIKKHDNSENSIIELRKKYDAFYAVTDDKFKKEDFEKSVKKENQLITIGIEVGHIFYFGDKYSKPLKCSVDLQDGKKVNVKMGSYGIGVSRLVAAIIEAKFVIPNMSVYFETCNPFIIRADNSKEVDTERSVLKVLDGDCETAIGVYSSIKNDIIELKAELFSIDGNERYYVESSKNISQANELGLEVGENLKRQSKGNYKK